MTRAAASDTFGRIYSSIYQDGSDFTRLSSDAQALYFVLIGFEADQLGYLIWAPGKFTSKSRHWDADAVVGAMHELADSRFVVFDPDHNELIVRTYVKYDFHLGDKSRCVKLGRMFPFIRSPLIRSALGDEFAKIKTQHPDWPCWEVFSRHKDTGELHESICNSEDRLKKSESKRAEFEVYEHSAEGPPEHWMNPQVAEYTHPF